MDDEEDLKSRVRAMRLLRLDESSREDPVARWGCACTIQLSNTGGRG